jgi:uncharacterized protein (DUF302 family)
MSSSASDAAAHVVIKDSPRSVEDTVARLIDLVTERGMKLFTVVDHSGEAQAVGLDLRDTKVVIFGAPKGGTPVMVRVPLAALDLPMKVLVFDDDGQTRVVYTAPAALVARYGIPDDVAGPLAGIEALTDVLVGAG